MTEAFDFAYFDDPTGCGYRGYYRDGSGDAGELPWPAARDFCRHRRVCSALDLGCAKGFLIAELLAAGVEATGYDISEYALRFAAGLPCQHRDLRDGLDRTVEAVFALGVLLYLREEELPGVLVDIHAHATRFLLVSGYYAGEEQAVPDPLRTITRSRAWWRAQIGGAGFRFEEEGAEFDVYSV